MHLLEAGRAAERRHPPLHRADLRVVDRLAETVHLTGQRGDLLLLGVGALALLPQDGVEVGHAGGAQVEAPGGEGAGHEERAGHDEDHDGHQPPGVTLTVTVRAQRGACSRMDVT